MAAGSVGFGAAADEDGAAAAALLPAPTPQAPPAAANASCQDTVLAVLTQHPSLTALVALIRTAGCLAGWLAELACMHLSCLSPLPPSRRRRSPAAVRPPQPPQQALPPRLCTRAGVEAAFQSDIAGLTVLAPTNAALALAVQLVPLIRFQAAALRAVLLQHLIVAPIEFSTQFVSC